MFKTAVACRAKDPSKCRVHGTSSAGYVLASVTDPMKAARRLNAVEDAINLTGEGPANKNEYDYYVEYKENVATAQELYDATTTGLRELSQAAVPYNLRKLSLAEQLRATERLGNAIKLRKAVLQNNESMKQVYDAHTENVRAYGLDTFDANPETGWTAEQARTMNAYPYGTPMVVETIYGDVLYTKRGDGLVPTANRKSKLSSMFLPRDTKDFMSSLGNTEVDHVWLQSEGSAVDARDIKRVTMLSEDRTGTTAAKDDELSRIELGNEKQDFLHIRGNGYEYFVAGRFVGTMSAHDSRTEKLGVVKGGAEFLPRAPESVKVL